MRRRNLRFVVILALAHIAAAGFMVALLYQIGSVTFGHLPYEVRMVACGAAAVVGIALDARAIKITGTIAETVGRVNVPPGAWGLNSNVIIFTPAGYTATPGNGCVAVAADQTKCIATAGPIIVS
ncbi:hypothetical protein ACFRMN_22015 [Streptomyces sp. NPDC056835]|uniref:hypothetical protein n=1 Tax=Streptomyces sp. NPDC056835 TaxID=3345956 RepID=UPI0036AFEF84